MTHSLPTRRSSDLPEGAAHIFVGAVVHRTMPGKLSADRRIDRTFIGHEIRFAARVCYEDRAQCLGVHLGNVKGAHFAIALDQCENGLLFRSEEHTSEIQSLMRISYAVFCLK